MWLQITNWDKRSTYRASLRKAQTSNKSQKTIQIDKETREYFTEQRGQGDKEDRP